MKMCELVTSMNFTSFFTVYESMSQITEDENLLFICKKNQTSPLSSFTITCMERIARAEQFIFIFHIDYPYDCLRAENFSPPRLSVGCRVLRLPDRCLDLLRIVIFFFSYKEEVLRWSERENL